MHGIARQGKFRVTHSHELGFTAVLEPDAAAHEAYPYAYEFSVTYRFSPTGLSCEFSLENRDQRPIPWSAGHHFYFTVPWEEGLSRVDYSIQIPATRSVRQDPTGQLTPGPSFASEEPLDRPELVDAIHLGLRQNTVVFGPRGTPGEVRVEIGTQPVPVADSAIVTWSGAADAPYYCVEPWMGPPNAAEHGVGLHWVPPRQTRTFSVAVTIA
jgi:galactose mutarotase-like enzyme